MVIETNISDYLRNYVYTTAKQGSIFGSLGKSTKVDHVCVNGKEFPKFVNEYWTAKQRQANSLHEVSYRACFKPQLPRFFIELLTDRNDIVYDPFSGRGTTTIESAILGRNVIANDISPLSKILSQPRLSVPTIEGLRDRLYKIEIDERLKADIDLSMFFHPKTESEIVSLKGYLVRRAMSKEEDAIDSWIRMVATNRLTGHSPGFFSVYTLPPNQAVSAKSQIKINQTRGQTPEYRDIRNLILRKSVQLTKDVTESLREQLLGISQRAMFLTKDARFTDEIEGGRVSLTVTSPPFLDTVQYADDNWLRCWFNAIDTVEVSKSITMSKTVEQWSDVMKQVFVELFRITKLGGWVAFEVGEVRSGKVRLDEYVVPLGIDAGFANDVLGWNYLVELAKAKPMVIRNERQMLDWLAHGKIAVAIAAKPELLTEFLQAGTPIKGLIPAEGTWLASGSSNLSLLKQAPHPNAAKIFVNWFLSKDGQTAIVKTLGHQSLRADVPTDHLAPDQLRQQGVQYFNCTDEKVIYNQPDVMKKAKELFGPLMQ